MARAVILMYHAIDAPRSAQEARFACPPRRFAAHLRALRSAGYRFTSLAELARALTAGGDAADGLIAVSLDDGFADNHEQALPILDELDVHATVFAVSGCLGSNNAWMAARGYPARRMLDGAGLRALAAAGITIGAHTVTHPRLPELEEAAARSEIVDSRAMLEDHLAQPVDQFAYPYGLFGDREASLVQDAGFALACSTRSGFNRPGEDPLRLRRIEVHGTDTAARVLRKVRLGTNDGTLGALARYYAGRAAARLGVAR